MKHKISMTALTIPLLIGAAEIDHMKIDRWGLGDRSYSDESGYADFTSIELIYRDMQNFMPCLRYQINGVSQYLYCTLLKGCRTYFTLNVSHYSPDNLFMTHFQLDEIPLTELKYTFAKPYKVVSEEIFKQPSSILVGQHVSNAGEIGGGRYKKDNYAERQSSNLYESTVVGNPSALIFELFDKDGLKKAHRNDGAGGTSHTTCQTPGCLEDKYGSKGKRPFKPAAETIQDWTTGNFKDYIDIMGIIKVIAKNPVVESIQKLIQATIKQSELIAKSLGIELELGNSLFCKVRAKPFNPYYLSGLDSHSWRWGYPFTDIEHSKTILNPLSSDVVGGEFIIPPSTISVNQTFGHIYPREGTVNQQQTSKASMVVTKRAKNLLVSNPDYRVIVDSTYRAGTGGWSRSFPPLANVGCHSNIAYTGLNEHTQAKYAWTEWPKYKCDLVSKGWKIAFIPISWSF